MLSSGPAFNLAQRPWMIRSSNSSFQTALGQLPPMSAASSSNFKEGVAASRTRQAKGRYTWPRDATLGGMNYGLRTRALSRRDFVKAGAAAGLGGAVLSAPGEALAQASPVQGITWDYEADVVVLGSGATGMVAAIRARDLGATVIVVDQNFDVGGKMIHSGGWISLGGGDAIQERDRMAADPEGLGLTAPLIQPEDLEDDPDRLFRDMTDWSVVNSGGMGTYRLNVREQTCPCR